MKKQNFGFTLIELLVVIVIIGILATISTATFSGYFAKARDVERQTYVQSVQKMILASQLSAESLDYEVAFTDTNEVRTALNLQGYDLLQEKNSIEIFLFTDITYTGDFLVVACKEDTEGFALGDAVAANFFSAGTVPLEIAAAPSGTTKSFAISAADAVTMCAASTDTTVATVDGFFRIGNSGANSPASTEILISEG